MRQLDMTSRGAAPGDQWERKTGRRRALPPGALLLLLLLLVLTFSHFITGCSGYQGPRPGAGWDSRAAADPSGTDTSLAGGPGNGGSGSERRTADALADEGTEERGEDDLASSARSLYRDALQRYVAGDLEGAQQDFTDASLAVELAAELELSEEEEEDLGILQGKIAFFLDQLAAPAAGGESLGEEGTAPIPDSLGSPASAVATARLPDVPVVSNAEVDKWIEYFQGPCRKKFQLWLERTGRYRDTILPILHEHGLPDELIYLSLIESGMSPRAYSWAHAVGLWQFIKSTARLYQLRVDWWVDERRDPVLSSRAASRHLRDLYVSFEDWWLALAAYNSGEGRVAREVKRSRTKDFWQLRLPRQTKDYVPKFMAAVLIGRDPARYGFTANYDPPLQVDPVRVEGPLSLSLIAQLAGTTVSELEELNPHLRQKAVPPGPVAHTIYVPTGAGATVETRLAALTPEELAPHRVKAPAQAQRAGVHVVRRGETLSGIAQRYRTSVRAIARMNNLRRADRLSIGQRLLLPGGGGEAPEPEVAETRTASGGKGTVYVVRRGDTVGRIARLFGVPEESILEQNGLRKNSIIRPGDELRLGTVEVAKAPGAAAPREPVAGERTYTVRRGDNLYDIANRFGTTSSALARANDLRGNALLRPGDRLKIPAARTVKRPQSPASPRAEEVTLAREEGSRLLVYTVKAGDTLGKIAGRFGLRIGDVRRWNGIAPNSNLIRKGQQLRLYLPPTAAG